MNNDRSFAGEKDMLKVNNLQKSFGGLTAVKDFSFHVERGKIVSLIGPNGAGKTTVFNLLTGIYKPDFGSVFLDDKDITGIEANKMVDIGISRTFQNIRLFRQMTVLQNVLVGYQSKINYNLIASILNLPSRHREEEAAIQNVESILELCGLIDNRNERADSLPYGKQRKLEIARALASSPSYLFLDEPAAGLNIHETKELSTFIAKLLEKAFTIVLIEHDMKVVMNISDYVYVLNYGKLIAHGTPMEIQKNEEVIHAYIGKKANA